VVLHRLYGVPTYSVNRNDDPVAKRVGPAWVGYRPLPDDRAAMAAAADVYFVKTHKRRKADGHPAVYLVRDGRDAVVSQARLRASELGAGEDQFERLLREAIARPYDAGQPSSGTWGGNVLSWLDGGGPVAVLRYEDLVTDPRGAVARAVSSLLPSLAPVADARVPSFGELRDIDPTYSRRGVIGRTATRCRPNCTSYSGHSRRTRLPCGGSATSRPVRATANLTDRDREATLPRSRPGRATDRADRVEVEPVHHPDVSRVQPLGRDQLQVGRLPGEKVLDEALEKLIKAPGAGKHSAVTARRLESTPAGQSAIRSGSGPTVVITGVPFSGRPAA
jgi:hypothetical protein